MQNPVDAEAHDPELAARFEVDVAGTLLEGILEQPVHQRHYMLLVGIEVLVLAQFDQLLEVLHPDDLPCFRLVSELHRFGQAVDF